MFLLTHSKAFNAMKYQFAILKKNPTDLNIRINIKCCCIKSLNFLGSISLSYSALIWPFCNKNAIKCIFSLIDIYFQYCQWRKINTLNKVMIKMIRMKRKIKKNSVYSCITFVCDISAPKIGIFVSKNNLIWKKRAFWISRVV